jgi:hypothetical protein
MTAKNKPTTGGLDGAKIGTAGDTYKLIAHRIIADFANPLLDTTGDSDAQNTYVGVGNAFVEKDIVFYGWMVGGAVFGFANLGLSDAGVAFTLTLSTGHTLAGTVIMERIHFEWANKAESIPIIFAGKFTGALTEADV